MWSIIKLLVMILTRNNKNLPKTKDIILKINKMPKINKINSKSIKSSTFITKSMSFITKFITILFILNLTKPVKSDTKNQEWNFDCTDSIGCNEANGAGRCVKGTKTRTLDIQQTIIMVDASFGVMRHAPLTSGCDKNSKNMNSDCQKFESESNGFKFDIFGKISDKIHQSGVNLHGAVGDWWKGLAWADSSIQDKFGDLEKIYQENQMSPFGVHEFNSECGDTECIELVRQTVLKLGKSFETGKLLVASYADLTYVEDQGVEHDGIGKWTDWYRSEDLQNMPEIDESTEKSVDNPISI